MKKIWNRLSVLSRYYFTSMLGFFFFFAILSVLRIDYLNTLFFIMSYVWHFTLLTPGLKEKMLVSKQRFSFLNVVVRINYYLQLFIKIKKVPFGPSIIRAISPLLFTLILMVAGGSGNVLFALLGSICFELSHHFLGKRLNGNTTSVPPAGLEIPPAIPNAENSHE
ncbi:MAG: hypothetical protein ACXVCE_03480 [Bacteriovorax sp.]